MHRYDVAPGGRLTGQCRVPGDKSISHRAIMLAALAEGRSRIGGHLAGEDCRATQRAFEAMGVGMHDDADALVVDGVGLHGLQPPAEDIDLGNSGTGMRLLSGLLAGQRFDSCLIGDVSLSSRPMNRVIDPLQRMGAIITGDEQGRAPLRITGGQALQGIEYHPPVASAQIKSCLLLAGLYAEGNTTIVEPGISRDHSERMLRALGADVNVAGNRVTIQPGPMLRGTTMTVPADLSSAAFFMVGAAIAPGSDLLLEAVGVNPTRRGIINILKRMSADIEVLNEREISGEPVADVRIRGSELQGVTIGGDDVPLAIDEFPAIFVAAACARGTTVLRDAAELRVKESDRIAVMADGLTALGADVTPHDDGLTIVGNPADKAFGSAVIDSRHDHRIAMAFSMAALRATRPVTITGCEVVDTSFPGFVSLARKAGLNIDATTGHDHE